MNLVIGKENGQQPRFYPIESKYIQQFYYRNVWCEFYETCLATAAFNDTYLDCSSCPMRCLKRKTFTLSHGDVIGCKALVRAIFNKGIYPK